MMLLRLSDRSIGLVSTVILARVLTPADFGLVAIAMTVVALIELMSAFGFDTALIQRQQVDRRHYDTAWTFNVLFGVTSSLLLLVLAYPAAHFYNDDRLVAILVALSISPLAQGFENIGTVAFRKELNFRKEFAYMFSKRLAAFLVTISFALYFRSFWALVLGTITGKLFSLWISYRLHPFRPRLSLAASHDLLRFSKWLFLSNLVLFLQTRADGFILGRTVGSHVLGLYTMASEIAIMPATELVAPINRAAFPLYARLAPGLPAFRKKFRDVFGIICLVGIPAAVGVVSVAPVLVPVMLGSQWLEAIPLLQLFAISGLMGALQSNLFVVILALGRPKANTLINLATVCVHFPLLFVASLKYGALGAAWVHVLVSIAVQAPLHLAFCQLTQGRLSEYIFALVRPSLAAAAMAAGIWAMHIFIFPAYAFGPVTSLIACVGIGALTYILAELAFWVLAGKPEDSAERIVLDRALALLSRRQPT